MYALKIIILKVYKWHCNMPGLLTKAFYHTIVPSTDEEK